jgi:hypothetical protein
LIQGLGDKEEFLKHCMTDNCTMSLEMLMDIFELCKVHFNFSDDDMVVHNIHGPSHQTKSAQLAWS